MNSEGVGLIVREISFQDFQPMWSWSTNVRQTDRPRDRRTKCNRQDHTLHYSAPRGKKHKMQKNHASTVSLSTINAEKKTTTQNP